MSDYRKVHDPFLNKDVLVSDKLTDRLRGKYASGPHLPNGNPEFGWRQFQAPPIQHEAAAEIERLEAQLASARKALADLLPWLEDTETKCLVGDEGCVWAIEYVRHALSDDK